MTMTEPSPVPWDPAGGSGLTRHLSSTVLDCPPVSVHQLHSLANRFIRRQYNINNRKHLVYFYSNKGLVICYNSLYWIISWYKYYLSNSNIFLMRVPAAPSTIVIFSFDLLIELAERLTDWLTDSMTKHKDDTDRGWEEDLRPPSQCSGATEEDVLTTSRWRSSPRSGRDVFWTNNHKDRELQIGDWITNPPATHHVLPCTV